ncbi:MAG TPA: hypothetical protein VKC63_05555 [Solirubrobacterales bacterium]|nr:hypothetical protein [Solirubrobacterales bacterium]
MALILPACGGERTVAAGSETAPTKSAKAPRSGATAKTPPAARRCGRLLGGFFDSLESLNNTLAVGLSYDDYLNAVNHVRATYASVQADHLPIVCLARVASPAEQALNVHIDAANTWGNCLATTSCNPKAVEPKLQREWAEASDLLSSAQSGLRSLG